MITAEVDGIKFTSAGLYYRDSLQTLAHSMKSSDKESISEAASFLAPLIPKDCCLIPAPSRRGYADHTLVLANEINKLTGVVVADVLKGKSRMSQYKAKIIGYTLTEEELGLRKVSNLPKGLKPIVLDNVIGTGFTGKAAVHALGKGSVIALAMDDSFYINANNLKMGNHLQTKEPYHERQNELPARSIKRTF